MKLTTKEDLEKFIYENAKLKYVRGEGNTKGEVITDYVLQQPLILSYFYVKITNNSEIGVKKDKIEIPIGATLQLRKYYHRDKPSFWINISGKSSNKDEVDKTFISISGEESNKHLNMYPGVAINNIGNYSYISRFTLALFSKDSVNTDFTREEIDVELKYFITRTIKFVKRRKQDDTLTLNKINEAIKGYDSVLDLLVSLSEKHD